MSHAVRRGATLVAALALAAVPLLGSAPAGAVPAAPAVVAIGCGSSVRPCVSLKDVICWEDTWCRVPVSISPVSVQALRLGYTTRDGSAHSGENYEPAQGVITIEPRGDSAAVPVFVRSSRVPTGEPATFTVTLSAPSGVILAVPTATVTIVARPTTFG